MRQYEWDEAKQSETLLSRGVDFADMEYFVWETSVSYRSDRGGEIRWSTYGMIRNRLHNVIWTQRGPDTLIISLRKANPREIAKYAEAQD